MVKKYEKYEHVAQLYAHPTKDVIKNKSKKCDYNNAICEVIDNCLDYWSELGYPFPLNIDIDNEGKGKNSKIILYWNMGIPRNRLRPLVRPGDSLSKPVVQIGTWGEGFKIAIFALGRVIEIRTRCSDTGEAGKDGEFLINIPEDWIDDDEDWTLDLLKNPNPNDWLKEDETCITITTPPKWKDPKYWIPGDPDEVREYLGEVYGTRIIQEMQKGQDINITYRGGKVLPKTHATDDVIIEKFAFPPGFEPTKHVFEIGNMEVTMVIGLTSSGDKSAYGTYMYGNGRLFAKRLRDPSLGYGGRTNAKLPYGHPHATRLQIHIFFEGPPEDIPWQAPLKQGFDFQSPIVKTIKTEMTKYGAPYAKFTRDTGKSEFLPYSMEWDSYDEEKRMKEFFSKLKTRNADIINNEERLQEEWKKAPKFIKEDFQPPKSIDTWDHSEYKNAPIYRTRFNPEDTRILLGEIKSKKNSNDIAVLLEKTKVCSIKQLLTDAEAGEEGESAEEKMRRALEEDEEGPYDIISARISLDKIDKLLFLSKSKSKSELVENIFDFYLEIQRMCRKHEAFTEKIVPESTDDDILEAIEKLLDSKIKKK